MQNNPISFEDILRLKNVPAKAKQTLTVDQLAKIQPQKADASVIEMIKKLPKVDSNVNSSNMRAGASANSTAMGFFPPTALPIAQPAAPIVTNTPPIIPPTPQQIVQSNFIPTPSTGSMGNDYSPQMKADAINAANGIQSNFSTNKSSSKDLLLEYMINRAGNKGMYGVESGVPFSPDQIAEQRNSADNYYKTAIGTSIDLEKKAAENDVSYDKQAARSNAYVNALNLKRAFGTNKEQRDENIAIFLAQTPEAQGRYARSLVFNNLSVGQQEKFSQGDNAQALSNSLLNTVPSDFNTNPYKYQGQKYSAYLGGTGDQKYKDFQAKIGLIAAPIINNIYGAAVTGGELDRANQFIPNLRDDSTQTVYTKLRNLDAFYEFANDALIANTLGMERPDINSYLQKNNATVQGTPKSGVVRKNNSPVKSSTGGLTWD